MNEIKLKTLNSTLLIVSSLIALGLITYASGGVSGLLSGFTIWSVLPYLILVFISYRAQSVRTLLAVTILSVVCILSTYLYFDSLFVHPDAQGALIFLFLPLYQLFATIVGFGILAVANFFSTRK